MQRISQSLDYGLREEIYLGIQRYKPTRIANNCLEISARLKLPSDQSLPLTVAGCVQAADRNVCARENGDQKQRNEC
jgi:hypothetical protein